MGHSPRDLKLYSKIIVDTKPWLVDPKIVPIPWRPVELPRQLSFAVIKSNNVINPFPPVARALDITIQKLKDAGHELIEWELTDQHEPAELSVCLSYDKKLTGSINSLQRGVSRPLPRSLRNQGNRSQKA
jgi:Asp-tRNA(Asn)/Glu-tRNA(Gln) amidotransferase A subunit family amidase